MKKILCFGAIVVSIFLLSNTSFGNPGNGAESIVLKGGPRGDINFPHGLHQGVTVDCMPCHGLFPKEADVVGVLKDVGKLKKREVMNMCKQCHKELASKGQKAGPTDCKGCHKK